VLSHAGRKKVLFARSRLKSKTCARDVTLRTGTLGNELEQKELEGEKIS
jgi:hypothetical protein